MIRKVQSWLRREKGVVAVEFALVTFPFIVLLLGLIEVSLLFTASIMLEGGTHSAARLIRTGEAVDSGDPEGLFAQRLCDEVERIIPCNEITYEVLAMGEGGFADAAAADPAYNEDGDLTSGGFGAGGSGEVVLVRAAYRYNFLIPLVGTLVTGEGGEDSILLMSTAVIRNEPYEFGEE